MEYPFVEGGMKLVKGDWGELDNKIIIYTKYNPVKPDPDWEKRGVCKGHIYAAYVAEDIGIEKMMNDLLKTGAPLDNYGDAREFLKKNKNGKKYLVLSLDPITEEKILEKNNNIVAIGPYNSTHRCKKNMNNAICRYISMFEWQKKEKSNLNSKLGNCSDNGFKNFIFYEIVDRMLCAKGHHYMYDFYEKYLTDLSKGSVLETETKKLLRMVKKHDIKNPNDPALEAIKKQVEILDLMKNEKYEKIPEIKKEIKEIEQKIEFENGKKMQL